MIFVNPYAGVNQDIPNIGLAYAATHFNVKVIDLNTLAFQRKAKAGYKLTFLDGHWNAQGHLLAAQTIARWLREKDVFNFDVN